MSYPHKFHCTGSLKRDGNFVCLPLVLTDITQRLCLCVYLSVYINSSAYLHDLKKTLEHFL